MLAFEYPDCARTGVIMLDGPPELLQLVTRVSAIIARSTATDFILRSLPKNKVIPRPNHFGMGTAHCSDWY
jgi:hypothetical protein